MEVGYICSYTTPFYYTSRGRCQTLYLIYILQSFVFLVNSRCSLFNARFSHPFLRTYSFILQSSFTIRFLFVYVYSTNSPVSV